MNLFKFVSTFPLHAHKLRLILLLLISFGVSNQLHSQYSLSLGGKYVYAYGERTIDLLETKYFLDGTHGFEFTANNAFRFENTNIKAAFNIGYRQLFFSGHSINSIYTGSLSKLIGAAGVGYVFNDKWSTMGYIEAENNLVFDEFYFGAGDLFRISLSLEGAYALSKKTSITVLFSRAMTPITPAYIFSNPQYQARVGLSYQLL